MTGKHKVIKLLVTGIAVIFILTLVASSLFNMNKAGASEGLATQELGNLPTGTRVVDPNWYWEYPNGELRPVTWIVVAKNHYSGGAAGRLASSWNHVTLLAEEIITQCPFDTSEERWFNGQGGSWQKSGNHGADFGIRKYLNGESFYDYYNMDRNEYDSAFWDNMTPDFQSYVYSTYTPTRNADGSSYESLDKIFLPSATELGYTESELNYVLTSGVDWGYFTSNAQRRAILGDQYHIYYTRSVSEYLSHLAVVSAWGSQSAESADNPNNGVRPALNMYYDAPVSAAANGDGVYEFNFRIPDRDASVISPSNKLTIEAGTTGTIMVSVNDKDSQPLPIGPDRDGKGEIPVKINRHSFDSPLYSYNWIEQVEYDYDVGGVNQVAIHITAGTSLGIHTGAYITADRIWLRPFPYYTVEVVHGAPAQLSIDTQPSGAAVAGEPFATQPILRIEDEYGNLATRDSETQVTALVKSGTGELLGSTTATAEEGIVTFSDLSHLTAEPLTIEFSAFFDTERKAVVSNQIMVESAELDNFLVESAQGGEIGSQAAGENFAIRVTARDRFGNTATDFTGTVDLSTTSIFLSGGGSSPAFSNGVLAAHSVTLGQVGTHTITAGFDGHEGVSNSFVLERGTPQVSQWPQAQSITYGQSLADSSLSGGEAAVPGSFIFAEKGETPNAGTGNVIVTFVPQDAGNYKETSSVIEIVVSKKTLFVTADNKDAIYDGSNFADFTVSYEGFVLEDSAASLGGPLSFVGEGTEAIVPGTYSFSPMGLSSVNYDFQYESGMLTISKAPITVAAAARTKVYGDNDPQLTYQITQGQLFGQDKLSGALSREPGEDVNSYPISQGTLDNPCYNITYIPGELSITPRALSITAENKVKMYGEDDPELTAIFEGFVFGEDQTALDGTLSITREPGEELGFYPITLGGVASSNYAIELVPGEFVISLESFVSPEKRDYIIGSGTDLQFSLSPSYGSRLSKIVSGDSPLIPGTHYEVSGENYTFYSSFLEEQDKGDLVLAFVMDGGNDPQAVINVRLSDQDSVAADKADLELTFAPGDSAGSITNSLGQLEEGGANATTITWTSSRPEILSSNGQSVQRQAYTTGDIPVTLTASIRRGDAVDTKDFELVVRKLPATDSESVGLDMASLEILFSGSDSAAGVTRGLVFPIWGNYGTDIVWISSNTNFVSHNGWVTRPSSVQGNQEVKVTAIISKNQAREEKEFVLTVLADQELPKIEAVDPAHGTQDVSRESKVTIEFTKPVQPGPAIADISLMAAGRKVAAEVVLTDSTLAITPLSPLDSNTEYEAVIPHGAVKDHAGNLFETQYVLHAGELKRAALFRFTTETCQVGPEVEGQFPSPGQTQVNIRPELKITYTDGLRQGGNYQGISVFDQQDNPVDIQVSLHERSLLISPLSALLPNSQYSVLIPAGAVEGASGIGAGETAFTFTTGTAAMMPSPGENATDVPVNVQPTIEFDKPVTAGQHFGQISLQDHTGNNVDVAVNLQGQTLVLVPSVNLSFASDYTVSVPAGALKYNTGQENSSYQFSFTTAPELTGSVLPFQVSPARHVLGDPVSFDASYIFLSLGRNSDREIVHYAWDMGDGASEAGRELDYSYDNPGHYTVTLTATDNKGQQYSTQGEVVVEALDNISMSVTPGGTLLIYEPQNEEQAAAPITFTIQLQADGMPLQGRTITVSDTWEVVTGRDGRATFSIARGELELGNTNISFCYEDRQVDRLVRMTAGTHSTYRFSVQDYTEEELDGLVVRVNGGRVPVTRDSEGVFAITNVPMGDQRITVTSSYYYDVDEVMSFFGKEHTRHYVLTPDIPSRHAVATQITSKYGKETLSDTGARKDFAYFQGLDVEVNMEASIDWKGHKPGYLLFITPDGKDQKIMPAGTANRISTFDLGQLNMGDMAPGRFQVVAVSGHGTLSKAYDCGIAVTRQPPVGAVTWRDGTYELSGGHMTFPQIGTSSISSSIPIFGSQTLGFGRQSFSLTGEINEAGHLVYGISTGRDGYNLPQRAGRSGISTRIGPVEIGGAAGVELVYAPDSRGDWVLIGGYLAMEIEGSVGYTQYFTIGPVPAYLDTTIGASADAKLGVIYTDKLGFHGELGFYPFVEVAIGAGVKRVASVEGYMRGSLGPKFVFSPDMSWDLYLKLTGGLRAQAFFMHVETEPLVYEWNSSASAGIRAFTLPQAKPESGEYSMLPRTYLSGQSDWMPASFSILNQDATARSLINASVENVSLQESIYPQPQPILSRWGDDIIMIWVGDNQDRKEMNHTQLQYSMFNGVGWNTPEFMDFGDIETADFHPALAAADSNLLLAWQKLKREFVPGETLEDLLAASEIAVAKGNPDGSWSGYQMLTDNNYLDHSPHIAAAGNTALLTWIRNKDLDYVGSQDSPNEIMFSYWDGNSWSQPATITDGVEGYGGADLAYDGSQGILTYAVEQRMYAVVFANGQWSDPVLVDEGQISHPQIGYLNGEPLLVWSRGDQLVYLKGSLLGDPLSVDGAGSGIQDYLLVIDDSGLAALSFSRHTGQGTDIHTLFYEEDLDVWSGEVRMTDNQTVSRPLSAIIDGQGNLKVAYTTLEWIAEEVDGKEELRPGQTDLLMATLYPRTDLAVRAEDISLSQDNPVPGSRITITAEVSNIGEFSASNVEVAFYAGDPAAGGAKIGGTQVIEGVLPARTTANASIEWTVPQGGEQKIFVVVDPEDKLSDSDGSNNKAAIVAVAPDLELSKVRYQFLSGTQYRFTADIANIGSIDLAESTIALYLGQGTEGTALMTGAVPALESGEQTQVAFTWDAAGHEVGQEGLQLTVALIAPEGVTQYREDNNIYTVVLYKQPLRIEAYTPAGIWRVPVGEEIELDFNMEIMESAEGIALLDKEGNSVEKEIEITGATLTVRPLVLEKDQEYILILEKGAVQGVDENELSQDFVLNFTTERDYPYPVMTFSFPFDQMDDVGLDTDIDITFNEEIFPGGNFSAITITDDNGLEAEYIASIQSSDPGEESRNVLLLEPAQLKSEMLYTVRIPAGAVENSEGEGNPEEISFSFTTVAMTEKPGPGDGATDDGDDDQDGDSGDGGTDPEPGRSDGQDPEEDQEKDSGGDDQQPSDPGEGDEQQPPAPGGDDEQQDPASGGEEDPEESRKIPWLWLTLGGLALAGVTLIGGVMHHKRRAGA